VGGRKYAIVLPAMDGGMDLEFVFTCPVYGSFGQFCRCAAPLNGELRFQTHSNSSRSRRK